MRSIFNQFSFLFVAGIIGLMWGVFLWRWRRFRARLRIALFAVYGVLVVAALLAFRYPHDPALKLDTAADVEALLHNSQPSLLMFYSDY